MDLKRIKEKLEYYNLKGGLFIYSFDEREDYFNIREWLQLYIYNNHKKELCLKYLDILGRITKK